MKYLSEKLTHQVPLLSLLLSAVYPWLMINNKGYTPYLGFALVFSTLATLVYFNKANRNKCHALLYGSILLLSLFLVVRAAEFVFVHNVLAIIYIGSILTMSTGSKTTLFHLAFAPILVFLNAFRSINKFPYKFSAKLDKKTTEKGIQEHIPAILITGIILLIVIPLLSSANPYFQSLVNNTLKAISPDWLFDRITPQEIFLLIVRFFLFALFLFFIPRLVSLSASGESLGNEIKLLPINYLIPKIVLSGLLLIFFFTQAQLYFAGPQGLQKLGYTNSQQTREVFAQLSIVAIIVFLLTYIDRAKNSTAKWFTYILVVEAFFLCGIAFKSVYDYTMAWGFTHKRLYGYMLVTWVTGMFLIFLYHFMKRTSHVSLVNFVIGFTIAIVLTINVLNFDYMIYNLAKSTTHAGIDHFYLSNLSPDAHSYKNHLPILMQKVREVTKVDETSKATMPAYNVLYRINYLQDKYTTLPPIGSFNISEYQEYLDIKNVDTTKYLEEVFEKEQAMFGPIQPLPQN